MLFVVFSRNAVCMIFNTETLRPISPSPNPMRGLYPWDKLRISCDGFVYANLGLGPNVRNVLGVLVD